MKGCEDRGFPVADSRPSLWTTARSWWSIGRGEIEQKDVPASWLGLLVATVEFIPSAARDQRRHLAELALFREPLRVPSHRFAQVGMTASQPEASRRYSS